MQIIYAKDQPHLFTQHYEQYIQQYQVALIYHPYLLKYFQLIAAPLYDESFVVIENNACVGICYCPIYQESNGALSISNNGGYTPIPLAQNKRILKAMFHLLDEIAMAHQCSMIKLYLDPQQHSYLAEKQIYFSGQDMLLLKKFGYIDTSSVDTVFNLTLSEKELWNNLSRNYRRYINSFKSLSNIQLQIMNAKNHSRFLHDQYVHYHHLCSRKKTRSDASFEIQYEMLLKGMATLFVLKYNNDFLSFAYCLHNNSIVHAHSAADNPKYENSKMPIYHFIHWNRLLCFKNHGYKTISIGQPSNFHTIQGFGDYCSAKEINIAMYKRGMGGIQVPLVRGIKYLDKKYLMADIHQFKIQAEGANQ